MHGINAYVLRTQELNIKYKEIKASCHLEYQAWASTISMTLNFEKLLGSFGLTYMIHTNLRIIHSQLLIFLILEKFEYSQIQIETGKNHEHMMV